MKQIKNISHITHFDKIYIHKDWREWFLKEFKDNPRAGVCRPYGGDPSWGFDINFVDHVPKYTKRWVFPDTPFVDYEESDEAWARPIGFGHEVETDQPAIWMINHGIVWHSDYMYNPFKLLDNTRLLLTSI